MHIPLVDLKAQLGPLRTEVLEAIESVLDSAQLVLGPNTRAFEEEFAAYCGAQHCVGVSNGTEALHLALRAVGIGPGDEVITVSHTFFATVEAIRLVGARAVLVDVDPRSLTIDVAEVEARVTARTKAIIPVHLYGRMADMEPLMQIAARHGLTVIEDASQAHGAEYRGQRSGSIGHMGCFSFYPSKNLGAYGEAGAVITSDPQLARQVRLYRDHGAENRYQHTVYGVNGRMDEVQAAVLRVKLRYLDWWNEQRRECAVYYDRLLVDTPVIRPELPNDRSHVWYVYVIRHPDRDRIAAALAAADIATGIHYPIPIHLLPACADLGYARGDLPVTERAAVEILSLPMFAELSKAQQTRVAQVIRTACGEGACQVVGLGDESSPAQRFAIPPNVWHALAKD